VLTVLVVSCVSCDDGAHHDDGAHRDDGARCDNGAHRVYGARLFLDFLSMMIMMNVLQRMWM